MQERELACTKRKAMNAYMHIIPHLLPQVKSSRTDEHRRELCRATHKKKRALIQTCYAANNYLHGAVPATEKNMMEKRKENLEMKRTNESEWKCKGRRDCGMIVVHGPRSTDDYVAVVGRPMWEHRIGISGPQLGRCITAHDAISSHTCGHVAPEALTLLLLIHLQEGNIYQLNRHRTFLSTRWNINFRIT